MSQSISFKRLSGEMITLEVDPTESTEQYKKRLNEHDPCAFPAHRTSLVYDNEQYHILVNTEWNLSVVIDVCDGWCVDQRYDCCESDCWKCDEYYEERRQYSKEKYNQILSKERPRDFNSKKEYVEQSLEYMKEYGWDGFEVDEWRGTMACDLRIPISAPTLYHLYVLMIGARARSCHIVYQIGTDSQEEYKDIMDEIWRTKRVKGKDDYIFTNYLSRNKEDGDRYDCILVFNANGELIEGKNPSTK